MKLIAPDSGRLVVFFVPEEVRPLGGFSVIDFLNFITNEYSFVVYPDINDIKGDNSVLVFKYGSALVNDRNIGVREFHILQSALIIDALTTEDAQAFLNNFWQVAQQFGYREPVTPLRIRAFSSIIVEFDADIEKYVDKLENICNGLTRAVRDEYEITTPISLKGISFAADPSVLPANAINTEFSIQRRLEMPYASNRYYCVGPFRTHVLTEIIQNIETMLRS